MKDKIAKWHKQCLWTDKMVQTAVDKGILTAEDAEEILSN